MTNFFSHVQIFVSIATIVAVALIVLPRTIQGEHCESSGKHEENSHRFGLERLYAKGSLVELNFTYAEDDINACTPDCVARNPLILVNNVWPPPSIIVRAGQEVRIRVQSELIAVVFSVHLHGIRMLNETWSDGTGYVTTCPVEPAIKPVDQVFTAPDEVGVYMYHGHVNHVKVSGFTGLFIVEPRSETDWPVGYEHDDTLEIMAGDSYHLSKLPVLAGLLGGRFSWPGEPQSVLVQGQGFFDCSGFETGLTACTNLTLNGDVPEECATQMSALLRAGNGFTQTANEQFKSASFFNSLAWCNTKSCPGLATIEVQSNKTYLVRMGNSGIMSNLNIQIEGHKMTLVELDALPIDPITVETFDLNQGQRASFLLTTDQEPKSYYISVAVRGRRFVVYGTALLVYDGVEVDPEQKFGAPTPELEAFRLQHPNFQDIVFDVTEQRKYSANLEVGDDRLRAMPEAPGRNNTFILLATQEKFDIEAGDLDHCPEPGDDPSGIGIGSTRFKNTPHCSCQKDSPGPIRWALNRRTYVDQETPLLHSLYFGTETRSKEELEKQGIYELVYGQTYDIVIQNFPGCNAICEIHPMHLHGHDFWVVGTFTGQYDPEVGIPLRGGGGKYKRDTINIIGVPRIDASIFAAQNTAITSCDVDVRGCGYTVIRFVADNPGVWFFHCHIDWHLALGMAAVFYYRDLRKIGPVPNLETLRVCGGITPDVIARYALEINDVSSANNATTTMTPYEELLARLERLENAERSDSEDISELLNDEPAYELEEGAPVED